MKKDLNKTIKTPTIVFTNEMWKILTDAENELKFIEEKYNKANELIKKTEEAIITYRWEYSWIERIVKPLQQTKIKFQAQKLEIEREEQREKKNKLDAKINKAKEKKISKDKEAEKKKEVEKKEIKKSKKIFWII